MSIDHSNRVIIFLVKVLDMGKDSVSTHREQLYVSYILKCIYCCKAKKNNALSTLSTMEAITMVVKVGIKFIVTLEYQLALNISIY